MTETYMLTIPRYPWVKKGLKAFIEHNDVHKWIVAKETGKGGYEHYQVRLTTGAGFERLKEAFPQAHIEQASEVFDYERKEGRYWTSEDTSAIRRNRFGRLDRNQERILSHVRKSNDRSITVVFDPEGNLGKSFLCRWLYEQGKGYYVPPTIDTVKGIIQFIASGYRNEGIIVIDIPRSWKWSEQLYTAIESIKDGLIFDTRYSAKTRDIYGVNVLVLTNNKPKLDKLSKDRWDILDTSDWKRIDHGKCAKKNARLSRNTNGALPPFRGEEAV